MATHWTYAPFDHFDEIEQGDILRPTEGLKGVFAEVHPHFNNEKYLGFMIATQSCDLVRRNGSSKASYISLAVIRPLAQVIRKVLSHVITPVGEGVFKNGDKREAKRLVSRLLNQNEQGLGLFFLYPDADAGIGEAAVAFLRVTVALRADHYEALREARCGRLTPEFRAKLGWLIGNLYVRPATEDWQDREGGKKQFDGLIRDYLTDARWLDDDVVAQARDAGVDISQATPELLKELRPPSKLERALGVIRSEVSRVAPSLSSSDLDKVVNLLRNNGKFTKLLKGGGP